MRTKHLIIITVIISVCTILIFLYASNTDRGAKNYKTFKTLHPGLSEDSLFQLMGKPDYSAKYDSLNIVIHHYLPPRYYISDNIKVVVDTKTQEVSKLIPPE